MIFDTICHEKLFYKIRSWFSIKGVQICQRIEKKEMWDKVLENSSYPTTEYKHSYIDHCIAFEMGKGLSIYDLSLIIKLNGYYVGIWPISISKGENKFFLTTGGGPIISPKFIKTTEEKVQKKIIKLCHEIIRLLAENYRIESWQTIDLYNGEGCISKWHLKSIEQSINRKIYFDGYIDLKKELKEIRKGYRDSYKSLVNSGRKIWKTGVVAEEGDRKIWDEFRYLHMNSAGKITRNDETWNLQYEEIISGTAILVWLKNSDGSLVGAGFFDFTRIEATYNCAAYDRRYFDKPLGHVVQDIAIEELKSRKIEKYRIGRIGSKLDTPSLTKKETDISDFKRGFITEIYPRYIFEHVLDGG